MSWLFLSKRKNTIFSSMKRIQGHNILCSKFFSKNQFYKRSRNATVRCTTVLYYSNHIRRSYYTSISQVSFYMSKMSITNVFVGSKTKKNKLISSSSPHITLQCKYKIKYIFLFCRKSCQHVNLEFVQRNQYVFLVTDLLLHDEAYKNSVRCL